MRFLRSTRNPISPMAAFGLVSILALSLLVFSSPVHAQGSDSSGTFVEKGYRVDGQWQLVREQEKWVLELDADFATKNGPDLKFFLSPRSVADVNGRNAAKESLLIGKLRSNRGAQRLELPAGTDLSKYRSLVLHCEKYSKLWAAAPLR